MKKNVLLGLGFLMASSFVSASTVHQKFDLDANSPFQRLNIVFETKSFGQYNDGTCLGGGAKDTCGVVLYESVLAENIRLEGVLKDGRIFRQDGLYAIVPYMATRMRPEEAYEQIRGTICSAVSKSIRKNMSSNFDVPVIVQGGKVISNQDIYSARATDQTLALRHDGTRGINISSLTLKEARERGFKDGVTGLSKVVCNSGKQTIITISADEWEKRSYGK